MTGNVPQIHYSTVASEPIPGVEGGYVLSARPRPPRLSKHWFRSVAREPVPLAESGRVRSYRPWMQGSFGPDSLRFYLSGAASDGGAQTVYAASLGNYRSSTEAERVKCLTTSTISSLRVRAASRWNGTDAVIGSLTVADDDSVGYSAPDTTEEVVPQQITNGQTKTFVDPTDSSKWLRIERVSASPLLGLGQVEFHPQLNNVFGFSNVSSADASSGEDYYRAVFLRNACTLKITAIKAWILPLGPSITSSAAQLSGAGSGTIQGAADGLGLWPPTGYARIETSGGTLREVVYYSSRTGSVLNVPAAGRSRLGTSAAAGSATDVVYPVPHARIAYEAASPLAGGSVQTIADELTSPTGLTWSSEIDDSTGLSIGDLEASQQIALWIHREIPASCVATPQATIRMQVQFAVDGSTYNEILEGLYRVANDALGRYELYVGVGSEPDISGAPDETFTSLPYTSTLTLSPSTTNYLRTLKRNKYGMRSDSSVSEIIVVDSGGEATAAPPTAPEVVEWSAYSGGTLRLQGIYYYASDPEDSEANQWLIYAKYDGSTPNPSLDSPTVVTMVKAAGAAFLDWTSPAQADGATAKVILRVRKSGTPNNDSANVDVHTATANTDGPSTPTGDVFFRGRAEQEGA